MCRGGGGNKSPHYKKKKYNLQFHFFFLLISENILSVPRDFCALQILIPAMPKTREEVAS